MGAIVFSLDAELMWGFHDKNEIPIKRIKCAREAWIKILELFDKYEINATWAIPGHLFLNECDGLHKNHPAGEKWFKNDPGGSLEKNNNFFGRDLIKKITTAKSKHEIGCHSFSHMEFDSITPQMANAELTLSIESAKNLGITLESFVFPRNKIGNLDTLRKNGFLCYRGKEPATVYNTIK